MEYHSPLAETNPALRSVDSSITAHDERITAIHHNRARDDLATEQVYPARWQCDLLGRRVMVEYEPVINTVMYTAYYLYIVR